MSRLKRIAKRNPSTYHYGHHAEYDMHTIAFAITRIAGSLLYSTLPERLRETATPYSVFSLSLGIVLSLTAIGCERQGPPPKPIGAATNKHVEVPPAPASRTDTEAMIQQMKRPMDKARQTEDVLRGAADRARQQSDQTTP